MKPVLRIVMVAGEASGDQLAAGMIAELKKQYPDCEIMGVAGPAMQAAGATAWFESEELAVMGLAEVLAHLPRIIKLRGQLLAQIKQHPPDLFIGIDVPDFNLGLEKKIKHLGIPVVHYVSPSVWAWRRRRVKKIHRSINRLLTLFPFETGFYLSHGVDARFVGHPMADEIAIKNDPLEAQATLSLTSAEKSDSVRYIALLPGSRASEVERLAEPMLGAAKLIQQRFPQTRFLAPMASPQLLQTFKRKIPADLAVSCFTGRMREVVAASEVVLVASGTAALETLLIGRPMVVCYKLAGATYFIAKSLNLIKSRFISLPNILADKQLVPELIQADANAEKLAVEIINWLENPDLQTDVKTAFTRIHRQLRQNANRKAVSSIGDLLP